MSASTVIAFDLAAIVARKDEIQNLARQEDVNRPIKRLLDYARDFSGANKDFEREAVALSAEFSRAKEKHRKNLILDDELEVKLNAIINHILELTDKIYDRYCEDAQAASIPREIKPLPPVPASEPPAGGPAGLQRFTGEEQRPARQNSGPSAQAGESPSAAAARAKIGSRPAPQVVFGCEGLRKSFSKAAGQAVLSDISIELKQGEITGLVGVNGVGKTTLLRIIAGELAATSGKVSYPALNLGPLDWQAIRHQISYVQQTPKPWYGLLIDNLYLSGKFHGLSSHDTVTEAEFLVQRLGLDRYRDAIWRELSGGYKMRFELAKALMAKPKLLILDEPLAPLDVISQQTFLTDLRNIADSIQNPMPIIVSSQHLFEIDLIADWLLFLNNGKSAYYGRRSEIGADRSVNLFEVSLDLDLDAITELLDGLKDVQVTGSDVRYSVRTARSVPASDVLQRLVASRAPLVYFRDLNSSSRRLFEDLKSDT